MGRGVSKGAGNGCTVVGHGGTVGMGDEVDIGGGVSMSPEVDMNGVDMTAAGIGACTGMEDEKCGVRL